MLVALLWQISFFFFLIYTVVCITIGLKSSFTLFTSPFDVFVSFSLQSIDFCYTFFCCSIVGEVIHTLAYHLTTMPFIHPSVDLHMTCMIRQFCVFFLLNAHIPYILFLYEFCWRARATYTYNNIQKPEIF